MSRRLGLLVVSLLFVSNVARPKPGDGDGASAGGQGRHLLRRDGDGKGPFAFILDPAADGGITGTRTSAWTERR